MTAIYVRQSIEKKDSLSIAGQIDTCKALCADEDFKIYEDRGYSGKNINRPAFNNLLDDMKKGQISKIIVYRLDRLSRSVLDFATLWQIFKEHNVAFVSVNENFDTSTPMGVAMINIAMVFAELERQTIAERVKDNYYQRVKKGAWAGGPAPFGTEIQKENGMAVLKATLQIDVVKMIFDEYYKDGSSLRKVAMVLNDKNIPCARRKTWDSVSVARVLKNPIYAKCDAFIYRYYKNKGIIIHNEIEEFNGKNGCLIVGKRQANERKYTNLTDHLLALSNFDGIINSDVFLACQYKMEENVQIKNTGKGTYTWLSGLLKCANCGYSLGVQKDKSYHYLVCSGRKNLKICDITHSEKIDYVESVVSKKLLEYIGSHSFTETNNSQETDSEILNQIAIYEEKIQNLVTGLSDASVVSAKYINQEIENLDKKIQELSVNLPKAKTKNDIPINSILELSSFDSLPFGVKKIFATKYIERVNCSSDDVDVIFKPL